MQMASSPSRLMTTQHFNNQASAALDNLRYIARPVFIFLGIEQGHERILDYSLKIGLPSKRPETLPPFTSSHTNASHRQRPKPIQRSGPVLNTTVALKIMKIREPCHEAT